MAGVGALFRTLKGMYRESSLKQREKRVAYLSDLLTKFTDVGKLVNENRKVRLKAYEVLLDRHQAERKEFLEDSIDMDIAILEKAAQQHNIKI